MSIWAIAGVLLVVVLVTAARGNIRLNVREVEDLEARLRAVAGREAATGASGSAEREAWDDGEAEFEAKVRGVGLPDGSTVEFVVAGVGVGTAEVRGGRARLDYDSRRGDDVPPVAAGQRIEVRHDGVALLEGEFRLD